MPRHCGAPHKQENQLAPPPTLSTVLFMVYPVVHEQPYLPKHNG